MKLGYIKLARQLLEHPIWTTERFTRGQAWVDLLLIAQFTPYSFRVRGNLIELSRGQIGHSKAHLAGRWKWDRKTVQRFLDDLQSDGMITQQKNKVVTVVTIVNYGTWQGSEDDQVASTGQQNPHQNGQQNGQQSPQQTGQQKGHKEEGKRKKKKVKKVEEPLGVFPESLNSDQFKAKWSEWVQFRKEKKAQVTPTMKTSQLKAMAKMGQARAIAMIDHTIFKGWQGLKEPGEAYGKPQATSQGAGVTYDPDCTDPNMGKF